MRYVQLEAGLPVLTIVGTSWEDKLKEKFGEWDAPSADLLNSDEFQATFSETVDMRIEFYKQLNSKEQTTFYRGYTTPNSGKGPRALQKAKMESEATNLAGPRLENGDYYSE